MKKLTKLLRGISFLVLAISAFCLFGFLVKAAVMKPNPGTIDRALDQFVSFPAKISFVANELLRAAPPSYAPDLKLKPINRLKDDLFGINSFILPDKKYWEIRLFNFRTEENEHIWTIDRENFQTGETQFENSRPLNGILLPERSLITAFEESNNLYRLDKNSKVVWHNTERKFHHSLNLGPDGGIWACTRQPDYFVDNVSEKDHRYPTLKGNLFSYLDCGIVKINPETGTIEYEKMVSDILIENGYRNFLFGFSNRTNEKLAEDPLHLNDIEPVMKDGPYWNKGDLFLSLRHRSLVIHYRPKTNKIIRLIYGPFLNQHDVDIVSESEISIFDNNTSGMGKNIPESLKEPGHEIRHTLHNAGIVRYSYVDSSFEYVCRSPMAKEKIATRFQGLHHRTSSGLYYVESQSDGIMYIMGENEILYRNQFKSKIDGWVERPHWIRIYENINF